MPEYDPARGGFTLEAGAILNTAGLLVDEKSASLSGTPPALVTKGGTVAVSASNIKLAAGSEINA